MKMQQQIIINDINNSNGEISEIYANAVGIQATPGTTFYFNSQSDNQIIMGPSGIYQLNFNSPIIESITFTSKVGSLPIIIDYIIDDNNEEESNNEP